MAVGWIPTPASAVLKVTRITPNTNTGSLPHAINTSLHLPVDVDVAPGVSDYYFVSQLGGRGSDGADGDDITKANGRIILVDRNTGTPSFAEGDVFLSIADTSLNDPYTDPEVGLFSTAFHPDFATNGKFYVSVAVDYPQGQTPSLGIDPRTPPFKLSIREYTANPNDITAGATFSKTILEIDQPAVNHNGSWLGFNPVETTAGDNYLYITVGDGGDQHDPYNYSQNIDSLLGKVLRVDVDGDAFPTDSVNNYAIPADNPFVNQTGRDEVWAYGLRNPWRASFDSQTGDFYVGDVGQGTWEEIHYLPADISATDDRNFGWRLREGFEQKPNPNPGGPSPVDNVDPIIAYLHGTSAYEGFSVTGGIVYRGPVKALRGMYIFADAYANNIWGIDLDDIDSFDPNNPSATLVRLNNLISPPDSTTFNRIVSFGEDEDGNLLIVENGIDPQGIGGNLYKVGVVNPGDYNSDGFVDAQDYAVWREAYANNTMLEDNEDDNIGVTDAGDFQVWLANYTGPQVGSPFAPLVPSPAAMPLLLGVLLSGVVRPARHSRD